MTPLVILIAQNMSSLCAANDSDSYIKELKMTPTIFTVSAYALT